MNSIINTYLDEVKTREEGATVGPWRKVDVKIEGWQSYSMVQGYQRAVKFRDFIRDFDADFMAHSRTDVPILHAMVLDLLQFLNKKGLEPREVETINETLSRRIQQFETN